MSPTPWRLSIKVPFPPAARLLPAYVVFVGMVEILTIGLSLFQVAISGTTARVIILLSLAMTWLYGSYLRRTANNAPAEAGPPAHLSRWSLCVLAVGAILYAHLWLVAWVRPDVSFDGNWYHIPNIHFWARQGYVHWVCADSGGPWCRQVEDYMNGYPAAAEVIGFVLVKATGISAVVNATNLVFLPMEIP